MVISAVGEGPVKCVQKLSVLCALVEGRVEGGEDEREEGKDLVSGAISTHSDWLGGCSAESDYRKGNVDHELNVVTVLCV